MILDGIDLTGRPVQTMAEDAGSPMGRHGVLGVQVSGRSIDGQDHTVVQILLDDDRPDFDRTLLDAPLVAELSGPDGRTLAREPFDHDEFRRRLRSEREAGESILRGVLVLTDGELPPPYVRLAFLPVPLGDTAGITLVVRRTTVTELLHALDDAYERGEVTDRERQAVTMTIEQRHPRAT